MKDVVFGVVLLVLAGGVVLLFAMFGELASRLPAEQTAERSQDVWALEGAKLGVSPANWPASIETFVSAPEPRQIFVLSTACAPCKGIASQVSDELSAGTVPDIAVVVSTASHENGEAFVKRYGLSELPHYIDEGGNWVRDTFGVDTSPSALTIRDGQLESIVAFQDMHALRAVVDQRLKGAS